MSTSDCPICRKHRGEGPLVGPLIYTDELVRVTHRAGGAPGYAFIESTRHVPSVDELTDREAAAVGRMRTRLTRGLRAELDVDFVHAMVAGMQVPHFHEHVFVRHAGTPEDLPWWQPWENAPRGDVDELAGRLRFYVTSG